MVTEYLANPNLFGTIAAILTTVAFFPQLSRTWTTKSADDVSFLMLVLFITGVLLWTIYGWKIHALCVIIANIITFILNLSILVLKIIFNKGNSREMSN